MLHLDGLKISISSSRTYVHKYFVSSFEALRLGLPSNSLWRDNSGEFLELHPGSQRT